MSAQSVARVEDLDLKAIKADTEANANDWTPTSSSSFSSASKFAHRVLSGGSLAPLKHKKKRTQQKKKKKQQQMEKNKIEKHDNEEEVQNEGEDDEEDSDDDEEEEEEEDEEDGSDSFHPDTPMHRFGLPFWRHLYGAPMPFVDDRASSLDTTIGLDDAKCRSLNDGLSKLGCAYRGSLLLSARVEAPHTSNEMSKSGGRKKLRALSSSSSSSSIPPKIKRSRVAPLKAGYGGPGQPVRPSVDGEKAHADYKKRATAAATSSSRSNNSNLCEPVRVNHSLRASVYACSGLVDVHAWRWQKKAQQGGGGGGGGLGGGGGGGGGLRGGAGASGGLLQSQGTRYSLVCSVGHAQCCLGSVVVKGYDAAQEVVVWPPPPNPFSCYELGGGGGGGGGGFNSSPFSSVAWPMGQVPDVFLHLYRHEGGSGPLPVGFHGNGQAWVGDPLGGRAVTDALAEINRKKKEGANTTGGGRAGSAGGSGRPGAAEATSTAAAVQAAASSSLLAEVFPDPMTSPGGACLVGFLRVSAAEVWGLGGEASQPTRMAQPRWINLQPNPTATSSFSSLSSASSGSGGGPSAAAVGGGGGGGDMPKLLVRLGIDTVEKACDKRTPKWEYLDATKTKPCALFVHLFQVSVCVSIALPLAAAPDTELKRKRLRLCW
jgi:hypothetical protein